MFLVESRDMEDVKIFRMTGVLAQVDESGPELPSSP